MTEKPKPKRRGIPSTHFTQEKANDICDRLAMGQSLRSICKLDGQPAKIVVLRWLRDRPEFRTQYDQARDDQADSLFDEVIDIAEDGSNDWMQRQNFDGAETGWHLNGEAVARSRLRIDTRKWMAGKLRPKKYGEKLEVDQTVGVTGEMASLLGRIAERGNRMISGMNLLENAKLLPAGEQNIASEAENDGSDQS